MAQYNPPMQVNPIGYFTNVPVYPAEAPIRGRVDVQFIGNPNVIYSMRELDYFILVNDGLANNCRINGSSAQLTDSPVLVTSQAPEFALKRLQQSVEVLLGSVINMGTNLRTLTGRLDQHITRIEGSVNAILQRLGPEPFPAIPMGGVDLSPSGPHSVSIVSSTGGASDGDQEFNP